MVSSPVLSQNKFTYSENACAVGGQCQKVFATDDEGKKVMIKGQPNYNTKGVIAEWFCAWLAERLGMKTNMVTIIDTGEKYKLNKYCSVHYWMDDFRKLSTIYGDELQEIKKLSKNFSQLKSMKLFDLIVENDDRHDSNYGYDKENDLVIIDHELCSPWNKLENYNINRIKEFLNKITIEENNALYILINNLLSITEQELVYLLIQLPYEFYGRGKNIIRRIMKIQKVVKKCCKSNKKVIKRAA